MRALVCAVVLSAFAVGCTNKSDGSASRDLAIEPGTGGGPDASAPLDASLPLDLSLPLDASVPLDLSLSLDLSPPPTALDLTTGTSPVGEPVGSKCSAGSDCTSDYCPAGLCACNKPDRGYVCQSDSDCCAPGSCQSGVCVSQVPPDLAPPVNLPVGSMCSGFAECASNYCPAGLCACNKPDRGYVCQSNSDCCAPGSCQSGVCASPISLDMAAPVNLPVGSMCSAGAECTSNYCPAGLCACNKPDRGYVCQSDSDCCAPGSCQSGVCASPTSTDAGTS